jgi:hypothetical protein
VHGTTSLVHCNKLLHTPLPLLTTAIRICIGDFRSTSRAHSGRKSVIHHRSIFLTFSLISSMRSLVLFLSWFWRFIYSFLCLLFNVYIHERVFVLNLSFETHAHNWEVSGSNVSESILPILISTLSVELPVTELINQDITIIK